MNERSEFYPRLKVDAASRSTVSQAGALLLLETVRATGLHRAPMARSWAGEPGWLPWGQLHDACPTGPDNQTPSRSPGRVRDGAGRAAQGLARVSGLERTPSGWPGTQLAVQAVTAGNDEVNTEPPDVHTYLRSRRSPYSVSDRLARQPDARHSWENASASCLTRHHLSSLELRRRSDACCYRHSPGIFPGGSYGPPPCEHPSDGSVPVRGSPAGMRPAPNDGQRPRLTGRPRKATSRSMAGACSAMRWAGPKRPARACSVSCV